MSPSRILNKPEDSFLFLLRGVEEARSIPSPHSPDKGIRDNFEMIQEQDYRHLFAMVKTSYYVTSFGDHDVWVIGESRDLNYYWDNYRRDQELKALNTKSLPIGTKGITLLPGIHRAFILKPRNIQEEDALRFVKSLEGIMEKDHSKCHITELPASWGVTGIEGLKSNANIHFISALLAAKIHQELGIDFAVVVLDDAQVMDLSLKGRLEMLGVIPKPNGHIAEWKNLQWKRLGSALFDDVIYAYAERTPAEGETAIVYYRFDKDDPHKFAEEIFLLVSEYRGFDMAGQYGSILEILGPAAKGFGKIIKNMKGRKA
jgi:hypothetical protein